MHMDIDQPRTHYPSRRIQCFGPGRRLAGGIGTDRGYPPVANQNISREVEVVGGIDHATTAQEQRVHGQQHRDRRIDKARAVGMIPTRWPTCTQAVQGGPILPVFRAAERKRA